MKLSRAILILALLGTSARDAHAGLSVPDPANSSTPPCIVVCPAGDIPIQVVVRDRDHQPINGARVLLDLCTCTGLVYCVDTSSCLPRTSGTDTGHAALLIPAGSGCTDKMLRLYADGVVLNTYASLASPDQDGDLAVTAADISIITSKLGLNDPSADFDCDGTVTDNDVTLARNHLGHGCPVVTAVEGVRPVAFQLMQNRPNPFAGRTVIRYTLAAHAQVALEIFNVRGERVATLVRGEQEPGEYEVPFGRGIGAAVLTPGVYFYRLRAGTFESMRHMLVLK